MKKRASILSLCIISAGLIFPQQVYGCACCADPGHREHGSIPISTYDFSVLSKLELDGPGNLYITACGQDCVSGIGWFQNIVDMSFNVDGKVLSIVLHPNSSMQTVLTTEIPNEMSYMAKDLMPGGRSTTVWLDTEFQITLQVLGSGPGWTGGSNAISAKLIFYGKGNVCADFAMTNHWLLDVGGVGQNANFRLYGNLHNTY